jgi:catecholate siderophore receptor
VLFGSEFIDSSSENDRYTDEWVGSKNFNANGPFLVNGFGISSDGIATSVKFSKLYDETTTDISVFSLYVQDEIELSEQLTVVLGARFDSFDIDVKGQAWNKNATPPALENVAGSQKDEEFTPRAGIVYKPKENISLYASYSQTFVPQSGEQFANLGTKGLDPDEFTNLEAGVKWDFADNKSVTFAIFKIEQDYVEGTNDDSRVEESEVQGFEAQYLGRISNVWTLSAGYTYLTGENAKDTVGNDRPGELPKSSFSIWNNYQLTEKLGLGLGAIYQDESTPKGGDEYGTVPDFIRFDAAAYYQLSDNLRLQLNIENLLDEEYYPHAYDDHQFTVGAPINATVSISGTF